MEKENFKQNKYKVCPVCGVKNEPVRLECTQCETDLTSTPVECDKLAITKDNPLISVNSPADSSDVMVRLCDCGAVNPVHLRKCRKCGEDISDITPAPSISDIREKNSYKLISVDEVYIFKVECLRTIIGREKAMSEYLREKPYVSRFHAELTVKDENLYIRNLSQTNYTYINNIRISDDEPTELHEGDIIGLGGMEIKGKMQKEAAFFKVRTE